MLGIGFILLLSFMRYQPFISRPGLSFADPVDGRGTISSVYAVRESFERLGARKVLLTDLYEWDRVGLSDEKRVISPISMFWKAYIVVMGSWLSPEGVYDSTVLLSSWTILLFGYLLMAELGASSLLAGVAAFMLSNLDNFTMRSGGHLLGLGFYGVALLLVWSAIHYAKRPSIGRALALGAVYAFSFQVNEYNTYFGTYVLAVTIPSALFHYARDRVRVGLSRTCAELLLAGAVALGLCVLLFPNLIGSALLPGWLPRTQEFSVHRPDFDYGFWTIGNPLAILQPAPAFAGPVASLGIFRPKHLEVSFRLGLLIFVSLGIFFACLRRWSREAFLAARRHLSLWLPALLVSALLGISLKNPLSLARLTMKVAPMFRVSARSLLYLDFAVIALFAFVATLALRASRGRPAARAALAGLVVLTALDVTNGRIFDAKATYALPGPGAYAGLAALPDRLLLELPHRSGPEGDGVNDETYYFFAQFHRKAILNNRVDTSPRVRSLGDLNRLDPGKLAALKGLGVGFVSANLGRAPDIGARLEGLPGLELVASDEDRRIYRIL